MTDPALSDPNYTYAWDKYSCVRDMWFFHILFVYFVFFTGLAAMVSRVVPQLMPYHKYIGRAYVISMIWAMATAFLIYNSGLPTAVLISFVWVLGGLSIGWIVITIWQAKRSSPKGSLWRRVFTLKTIHGCLFFTSWFNIAGRIFASNQKGDFVCYSYPYYKNITTSYNTNVNPLQPIPVHDPNFSQLPWAAMGDAAWGVFFLLGPILAALLVATLYVRSKMPKETSPVNQTENEGNEMANNAISPD